MMNAVAISYFRPIVSKDIPSQCATTKQRITTDMGQCVQTGEPGPTLALANIIIFIALTPNASL